MAVSTVLSVCFDCNNSLFEVKDDTKTYDATSNPTGWGSPNAATSDVTSSVLYVTSPSGVTTSAIDVSAKLPSTDVNDVYNFDPLANSQSFEDGIWLFEWVAKGTFGGDDFYLKASKSVLVTCSVSCCVEKLGANLGGGCGCGGGCDKTIDAVLTYEGVISAFDCGNHSRASYLLTKLQDICNNNCKGC